MDNSMNRGVRFETPNGYFGVFSDILKNVDPSQYYWFILDDQVFHRFDDEGFFESDRYSGNDFVSKIQSRDYYGFFANIQAFPSEKDFVEISTYDDFLRSRCEIIILIVDSYFIDVYAKDERIIQTVKQNALDTNFSHIEYITEQNDRYPTLRAL